MSFDFRRFQNLQGTSCECRSLVWTDQDGARISQVKCCMRCWELGMMQLAAERSRQTAEVELKQLELDVPGADDHGDHLPSHGTARLEVDRV